MFLLPLASLVSKIRHFWRKPPTAPYVCEICGFEGVRRDGDWDYCDEEVLMTQIKFWVIDPVEIHTRLDAEGTETRVSFYSSSVKITQVLDENDVFDPPPWVRHGIEQQGWRVLQKTLPPSGLNDMASVDWKSVADGLAGALQSLLEQEDLDDTEPSERAGSAMDDYRIAEHEEALRSGPEIVEVEDPDDD